MVLALLGGKDVRHAELAARFPGSAHNASVIRRVERFFDRHPIQPADVARVVLTLLPSAQPREFILDRTNWKYGQTDVNVLLLAVIWRGVAIPLLYELLPHGGGSHTEIRHTLMDDALCLLCAAEIRVLYADREFVGYDWIQGLACRGIPICVRLRSDTLMDDWTAKDWLSRLQTGTAGLLVEDTLVYGQPMNVVLTHTRDGESLIIASNAGAVTTIQTRYRRRFLIEDVHHFASYCGAAPVERGSGKNTRWCVNVGGNRQLNRVLHLMALTRLRCDERTKTFVARKEQEGKTKRAALRALKTHLARELYRTLQASHVGGPIPAPS